MKNGKGRALNGQVKAKYCKIAVVSGHAMSSVLLLLRLIERKFSFEEAHLRLCAVKISVYRVAGINIEIGLSGSLLGSIELHASLGQIDRVEQQDAFLTGIESLCCPGAQTVDAVLGKGVIGVAEGGAGFVEPLLPLLLNVGGVSVVFAAA